MPESWVQDLRRFKTERGKTYEALGHDLAKALGRTEPVPVSTVHGYFVGRGVTEELTRAFAQVAGLPLPPMGNASDDPEVAEWTEIGRRMKSEVPERFRRDLEAYRGLIEALDRLRFR